MRLSINQLSHREYLKSALWQKVRAKALEHYGKICSKCNEFGTDVHHLYYPEFWGEEEMSDLMVLCRSCHDAIHGIEKGNSYNNVVHIQSLYNYLTDKQKEIISSNLQVPLCLVFMSDSIDGRRARNMAVNMLNVRGYYGLDFKNKFENEAYLTPQESQKIKNKEKRKQIKKQNAWKKLLIASNPRLHGKSK